MQSDELKELVVVASAIVLVAFMIFSAVSYNNYLNAVYGCGG